MSEETTTTPPQADIPPIWTPPAECLVPDTSSAPVLPPRNATILTPKEAQQLMRITKRVLQREIARGRLKVIRLGPKSYRISRRAIAEWAERAAQ